MNDSPLTACGQDAALALDRMPENHDAEFRDAAAFASSSPSLVRTNPQIQSVEAVLYTVCKHARAEKRSAFRLSPSPGNIPIMPDYRRNRGPGGTLFFTANLLDRRSDLLVTKSTRCERRLGRSAPARRSTSTPGSSFPTTCTACGPRRKAIPISPALPRDQERVFEIRTQRRAAITAHDSLGRTRDLAATIFGAYDPR